MLKQSMEDEKETSRFETFYNGLLVLCLIIFSVVAVYLQFNAEYMKEKSRDEMNSVEIKDRLYILKKLLNSTKKLKWTIKNFAEENKAIKQKEVVLFIKKTFDEYDSETKNLFEDTEFQLTTKI